MGCLIEGGGCFSFVRNTEIVCQKYLTCSLFKNTETLNNCSQCCCSNIFRELVRISYFIIIIPILILLVLLVIKILCFFFKTFCSCCTPKSPVRQPIILTQKQKEILIKSLKEEPLEAFQNLREKDLNKPEKDIEWLSVNGLFRHKGIPGIIFNILLIEHHSEGDSKDASESSFCHKKISNKDRVKHMFDFANNCWKVCIENNLNLLKVPNVGMENLGCIHGEERHVLMVEELIFESGYENQFILRKNLSENLKTAVFLEKVEQQVVDFVMISGYQNVTYGNIVFFREGSFFCKKPKNSLLKAAIIDFTFYQPNLVLGLIGRNLQYEGYFLGRSLFTMINREEVLRKLFTRVFEVLPQSHDILNKALERRSQSKSFQEKQKQLHKEKGIKTGKELFTFTQLTEEDFQGCTDPQLGLQLAKQILKDLNSSLEKTKFKSLLLIRQAGITASAKGYSYAFKKKEVVKKDFQCKKEPFRGSFLEKVCEILVRNRSIAAYVCSGNIVQFWF